MDSSAISRAGRAFTYAGTYRDISRDFVSDLGFIPRTDIRETRQAASYTRWTKSEKFLSYGPTASGVATWNHGGELQDWSAYGDFTWNWVGATALTVGSEQSYERFAGLDFRKHLETVSASTEWWRSVKASISYSQGTGVNYFPAAGLDPFLGDRRLVTATLSYSPVPRLRIDETFIYDDLYTRGGDDLVFRNPISRTKINFQFNRFLAVRLIVDAHKITPDESLIALPRTKHVTGDLLFSYVLHPGTVLYAGYSDHYDNVALISGPPSQVVPTHSALNLTARQFFMKVSYLLRY